MEFSTPSRRYGGVIYSRPPTPSSESTVKKVKSGETSQMISDGEISSRSCSEAPALDENCKIEGPISIETATYF